MAEAPRGAAEHGGLMKNLKLEWIVGAALVLSACSGFEARRPPFTLYESAQLNGAASTSPPPKIRFDPTGRRAAHLVQEPGAVGVSQSASSSRSSAGLRPSSSAGSQIVDWRPEAPLDDPAEHKSGSRNPPKSFAAQDAPPDEQTFEVELPAAPEDDAFDPPSLSDDKGPLHAAEFIRAIYKVNGVDLEAGKGEQVIATLHDNFKRRGRIYHATRPAVGDVIFFHNTFDRNNDGRNNDWYTHVGLVEGVDEDGTIHVLSYLNGKVDSFVVNLENPRLARNKTGKKLWNATLRTARPDDPPFTQQLAGELFAGFGSLLGDRTELMVIDNWSPSMDLGSL